MRALTSSWSPTRVAPCSRSAGARETSPSAFHATRGCRSRAAPGFSPRPLLRWKRA